MKKEISIKDIVLVIVALMLTCINIASYINSILKPNYANNTNNVNTNEVEVSQKTEEEELLESLKEMTERERMEYYFSEYAKYIEAKEYQKAYDLLYPEFKEQYFPTLEKFIEYVKKIYPDNMAFSYNNIDRQGYIYVLNIDIIDVKNKENNKSHRVVITENDYNDFTLSFQVI